MSKMKMMTTRIGTTKNSDSICVVCNKHITEEAPKEYEYLEPICMDCHIAEIEDE